VHRLLLLLWGCVGPATLDDTVADSGLDTAQDGCDASLGWDTVGQPYSRTWCTSCHSSTLVPEARQGAPEGVDFDTYAGVTAYADRIAARIASVDQPMPPVGEPPADDTDRMVRWLDCGAPE
jgi:uncharacterized membrane protein